LLLTSSPILSFSGLHLTTLLTEDIEESEMRERALAADVGVYPLSRLGMSARPKGLLFGFGNIPLTLIRDGLARLTAVFADHNFVRTIRGTGKTSSLQPFMDDPPRGRLAWRTSRRAPSRISRMGRERKHGDRSLRIAGADSMTVATLTASRRAVSLS
jgi:hypothetical protein